MPRTRFITAAIALLSFTACAGLKDALSGGSDTVARAGSQQLAVPRLVQLMVSTPVPARKDVAMAITNLWVSYQLLGHAAATGDTVMDVKLIDDAQWAQIANLKGKRFSDALAKAQPNVDTAAFEKHYNDGGLLVARHILFMGDAKALKPAQFDSVRRVATGVLKQVTPANFAAMATKYTQDPGSKQTGGEYVFPRGQMVPEFEKATLALKPGEVSGLVQTQFGFHIIMRETWADAKAKFSERYMATARGAIDSVYYSNMEKSAKVVVKPDAAKTVKAIGVDVEAFRDNNTVLATSTKGNLTAARLARWVAAYPPQAKIREQIAQAPDSMMPTFVKYVMRNDLMLKAADSAKITIDTAEMNGIHKAFTAAMMATMTGLGVAPAQLADSAKSRPEREKLAAARVEKYLNALLKNQTQFVDVSEGLASALHQKYEPRLVATGVDRAVTEATKAKAAADSAKAIPSVVPMPGGPPAAPPAAGQTKGAPAPTGTTLPAAKKP